MGTKNKKLTAYVLFLIGFAVAIPIWWELTSVPKQTIPNIAAVSEWRNGKRFDKLFSIDICIEFADSVDNEYQSLFQLRTNLQMELESTFGLKSTVFRVLIDCSGGKGGDRLHILLEFNDKAGKTRIAYDNSNLIRVSISDSYLRGLAATHKLAGELASIVRRFSLGGRWRKMKSGKMAKSLKSNTKSKRKHYLPPSLLISYTLVNSVDSDVHVEWDWKSIYSEHILPAIDPLVSRNLFNISVNHNVILDASTLPLTGRDHAHGSFTLPSDWLPVTPSDAQQHPLHFFIYVAPSARVSEGEGGLSRSFRLKKAFSVSKWGGVAVVEPHFGAKRNGAGDVLVFSSSSKSMVRVMGIFTEYLYLLVGKNDNDGVIMRQHEHEPCNFPVDLGEDEAFEIHPSEPIKLPEWELNRLVVQYSKERLKKASHTLHSFVKLVDSDPSMSLAGHVLDAAKEAIVELELAKCDAYIGAYMGSEEILAHATRALYLAEGAFYDSSVLSFLYFPDEFKYAIYIPLFVPVAMSFVFFIVRKVKKAREEKQEKEKKE